MRAAEWINLGYFSFLIVLAWQRRLTRNRRTKVAALGIAAIILVLSAQYFHQILNPLLLSVIRDWLPAPLFLVAYWTAGQFFTTPNEELQDRLIQFDRKVLGRLKKYQADAGPFGAIAVYFELAYLLCYPLVPFGIGVLYIAHIRNSADEFWRIVLPSAYLCFAALPFAQTVPPRMLTAGGEAILPPTKVRKLNIWILDYGSIQANTFPSGHVATSFSISLVLLHLLPPAGLVFLWISVSIAIGAVLGRYHYAADALAGAAVAMAIFFMDMIWF
jgi:membrane-associated phospholipid phosphatase